MHASAIAADQDTGPAEAYAHFRSAVAQAQVTHWLAGLNPCPPAATIIDISGPGTNAAQLAAEHGHQVMHCGPVPPKGATPLFESCHGGLLAPHSPSGTSSGGPGGRRSDLQNPVRVVGGDPFGLDFLADGCADGVIAEDGTLSRNLAAESLAGEIARVLRPGGRVLACVDSQTRGMAALAQQNAWPNLCDLPHADVLLVPWPDGTITRCYGAEQLRELFSAAGFDVSWIRPRTIFAPRAVSYLLGRDPHSFPKLLSAELHARSDDSVGDQLVISARKKQ